MKRKDRWLTKWGVWIIPKPHCEFYECGPRWAGWHFDAGDYGWWGTPIFVDTRKEARKLKSTFCTNNKDFSYKIRQVKLPVVTD